MIFRKNRFIKKGKSFAANKIFKPNDRWLSSSDLVFSSTILEFDSWHHEDFVANSLIVLSHVVTTCVLSNRLCFVTPEKLRDQDRYPDDPLCFTLDGILSHFPTVGISEEHDVVTSIEFQTVKEFSPFLSKAYMLAVYASMDECTAGMFSTRGENICTFLADILLALRIPASFMPNPFLGHEIFPHVARSALMEKKVDPKKAEDILLSFINDLRCEVTQQYNELRELDIYDISLPSIFSVILRECNQPEDIFSVAAQIRDEATGFRTWCAELNKSKDPVVFLQGIEDAKQALNSLGKVIDARREERLQISVIPGFLKKTVSYAASPAFEKAFRGLELPTQLRGPIGFLLNLLQSSRQIATMKDDLVRIFGFPEEFATRVCSKIGSRSQQLMSKKSIDSDKK